MELNEIQWFLKDFLYENAGKSLLKNFSLTFMLKDFKNFIQNTCLYNNICNFKFLFDKE